MRDARFQAHHLAVHARTVPEHFYGSQPGHPNRKRRKPAISPATMSVTCSRFTLRTKLNILLNQFSAELRDQQLELRPRYNIPPTTDVLVITAADGNRWASRMRCGLLPSWTKDPKKAPLLNNARAETVAEKPSFRSAFKSRRCLIPADGYHTSVVPTRIETRCVNKLSGKLSRLCNV